MYQLGNWKAGKTRTVVVNGGGSIVPAGELEGREDLVGLLVVGHPIVPAGELEGREDTTVIGVAWNTIVPAGELEGRED